MDDNTTLAIFAVCATVYFLAKYWIQSHYGRDDD